MKLQQFEGIEKQELAMVNVAYAVLNKTGEMFEFNDLLKQVSDYLELDDNEITEQMVQFYTDLNTDGRFISLGENRWGLREWYPVDSIDEELTHDNDIEDLRPKLDPEGFDDFSDIEKHEATEEEVEEDDETEYGDRVDVDEHGVMVEGDEDEDLGEYKDDIEDLDEGEEGFEDLSVVEDDEVLEDQDEEDEENEEK